MYILCNSIMLSANINDVVYSATFSLLDQTYSADILFKTIVLHRHEARGPGVEYRWSCGEGSLV